MVQACTALLRAQARYTSTARSNSMLAAVGGEVCSQTEWGVGTWTEARKRVGLEVERFEAVRCILVVLVDMLQKVKVVGASEERACREMPNCLAQLVER